MAKWTYVAALEKGVFPHEGGYSNDAADPGGPTNFGITIHDARQYWRPDATAADVRGMPKSAAEAIYAEHYAKPLRYDDLPAGLDYCVLDYGINSGISRAAKVLQRLCEVKADGVIGEETLAAVAKRDPKALIVAMCDERLRFLQSLKTWPVFGKGWGRRVAEVKAMALGFAEQATRLQDQVAIPQATPTPAGTVMGKGEVPRNPVIKAATENKGKVAAGASIGTAASFWAWLQDHQAETAIVLALAALAIGFAVYMLERRRRTKQDAPVPGVAPVPVKAGA